MSKKRGLSLEDKRTALLSLFHETKEPYVLKDLEKLGPKKGVISQSVKDVLQSLAGDDLIHCEKIGSALFYWSFPSEASVKLASRLKKLQEQAAENHKTLQELEKQLKECQESEEVAEERSQKMQTLMSLNQTLAQQEAELAQYSDNDPRRFEMLSDGVTVAKAAANRWLENLEALKSWLNKRFEGQTEQLNAFFKEVGYKSDMEYL